MSKTTRTVQVAIGDRLIPVGTLVFEPNCRRERSMFRYAPSWLEDRRGALPYPIADGPSDSWGRAIMTKSLGGSPTELEFLLAADNRTRQGALRPSF